MTIQVLDHFSGAPDFPKHTSKFLACVLLDSSGVLYVPARYAGPDLLVELAARFEGAPIQRYRDKPFVSAAWMAKEYPECAEFCWAAIAYFADHMLAKIAPREWLFGDSPEADLSMDTTPIPPAFRSEAPTFKRHF